MMHVCTYDKFMPLVGLWEKHEEKQGNRGCLFQGCSTVALADRCVTVAFVALSKKKYKNLLTGIILAL